MEIYALVGKSGTGKSYKSHIVARTYDIEFVIDDGLLIKGTKIIAGSSAKREKTKFGAVRRAIFKNEGHKEAVKDAILHYHPSKILLIGTSEHMIQSIIEALELKESYKLINIEDISSREEMEIALSTRKNKGKHVIPVPTFEIKKAFSGYFIDSVRHWARRGDSKPLGSVQAEAETVAMDPQCSGAVTETTVVRPTFSYLGSFEIKDAAIKTIIDESAIHADGIFKVNSIHLKNEPDGITILLTVTLNCKTKIPEVINKMVIRVKENVEFMTGLNVLEFNTIIKSLIQ